MLNRRDRSTASSYTNSSNALLAHGKNWTRPKATSQRQGNKETKSEADAFSACVFDLLQAEEKLKRIRSAVREEQEETTCQKTKANFGNVQNCTWVTRCSQANAAQSELDSLNAAVKQIEGHRDASKDELSVARREAQATASASRQLGKEKEEQDFLVIDLQRDLERRRHAKEALQAQLKAQVSEKQMAHVRSNRYRQENDMWW